MNDVLTHNYAVVYNPIYGTRAYVNSTEGREMLKQDLTDVDNEKIAEILSIWGEETSIEDLVHPVPGPADNDISQRVSDIEDAIAELAFGGEV